jgi:indolepyruvate ferredoxin oxidoreductase beta subunit
MQKNIILAGVGGQGIVTISVVIVNTAIKQGLDFRQAEIHGMSQRGGAVESHVRLSDKEIYSDLIAKGNADLIIAVEPLEALRVIDYLSPDGTLITNTECVKNVSNYPDEKKIVKMLSSLENTVLTIDAKTAAKEAGSLRTQNIVMAGAASKYLGLEEDLMEQSIKELFGRKGQSIVDINLKAFEAGKNSLKVLEKV